MLNTFALIMAPSRQERVSEPTPAKDIFWRSPNFRLHYRYASEVLKLPDNHIFVATFLEGYELVNLDRLIPRKFNKVPTQAEYPIWGDKVAVDLFFRLPHDVHLVSLLNNKCSAGFEPSFARRCTGGVVERPLQGRGILGMQMQWILQQLEEVNSGGEPT